MRNPIGSQPRVAPTVSNAKTSGRYVLRRTVPFLTPRGSGERLGEMYCDAEYSAPRTLAYDGFGRATIFAAMSGEHAVQALDEGFRRPFGK